MAIDQTSTAAEFLKKAQAAVPGSAKTASDPRLFSLMLRSGLGASGDVLGKSSGLTPPMITGLEMLASDPGQSEQAALSMLGYGAGQGGMLGGLDNLQAKALTTLYQLTQDKGQAGTPDGSQAAGGGSSVRMAVDKSAVRQFVDKSAVRMAVNKSARHPDDLGHLSAMAGSSQGGFTPEEEQLIMAAAGQESLLASARSVAEGGKGKVLPSSLERVSGRLSAQYESEGAIDCISYDSRGGTSYGQFQIASKTGTMDLFIKFLEDKAPDLAAKLKAAGPADTGGKSGRMPTAWKAIASADPKRFEALQHEFIRVNNYAPALKSIVLTSGVDVSKQSYALREVLWSTAVQHGPNGAERIFSKAIETADAKAGSQDFDKAVIEEVYRLRDQQFGRHSKRIRSAVSSRFKDEKSTAIALLAGPTA